MRTLSDVMRSYPHLNWDGFTIPRHWLGQGSKAQLADSRRTLLAHHERILATAAWIQNNLAPRRTTTLGSSSLKSLLERQQDGWYITNGEFIAAGIIADLPWKYDPADDLDVRFGVSRLDIRRLTASAS